ncbi:MAG: hypothetical protein PHE55_07355 [Methylococcaceae bacterium]|nr:hypothetical protein [Methylococcaceae bacterium]
MKDQPISIITSDQIRLLETCDFEHQPPGTILRDFDTLLELIGDAGMPITPGQLIALSQLQTLNSRLSHPVKLDSKRPVQRSYPPINGLYLVLRSTGLATIGSQARRRRVSTAIDQPASGCQPFSPGAGHA